MGEEEIKLIGAQREEIEDLKGGREVVEVAGLEKLKIRGEISGMIRKRKVILKVTRKWVSDSKIHHQTPGVSCPEDNPVEEVEATDGADLAEGWEDKEGLVIMNSSN